MPSARSSARTRRPASAARPDRAVALLLVSTAALVLIGLVMVLSASSVSAYTRFGSSFLFFKRHLVFAGLGVVALAVTSKLRYEMWRRLAGPMLVLSTGMLIVVLLPGIGTVAGGASRWLEVGPVTIQPSEITKLAVVVFGAALLAGRWKRLDNVREVAIPLAPVVGGICALILLEPDLGTALIVVSTVFVLLFAAGVRLAHLTVAGLGTGTIGFALIVGAGYRWSRLTSFLDPWADPQGGGYQIIQSLIALASGGPIGVGLGASRQKWSYVPNGHTDFIFAIIGEELGLIGTLVVLALFGIVVYATVRIALRAPDVFGRLLAAGIAGWIGIQALVNLGAVTGLLPITGVPLPFVSFGGSSLVVSLAAVGILVSVGRGNRVSRRSR